MDLELGDELRAFKKGSINNTPLIFESFFNCYKYLNTNFDLLLYVPSNKNNNVMNFFANTISKTLNIKKSDDILLNKNIKEQKVLETLKERATLKELIKLLKENNITNIEVIVFCYRNYNFEQ